MTRALANGLTAALVVLALTLGWIGSDALDWWRRKRAAGGTGVAKQIGDVPSQATMAEFPNRAIRRQAAREQTRRMMAQASAIGRRMVEKRDETPAPLPPKRRPMLRRVTSRFNRLIARVLS